MATFEKRGKFWRVRVRRHGFPEQSRTFDTKAQAQSWARMIEGERDRGLFVDRTEAERNLLSDIIDRYMREVTPLKRGSGPETSRLNAMKRHPIARIKMASLSGAQIASYRDDRTKEVSAGTVIKELNHLAHVIETARREWNVQMPENPVRMVRRPKAPPARDRRLSPDEEDRLAAALKDSRNPYLRPIVQLAIETAARQGELVRLRWEHVDLERRVAHIPETKNEEPRSIPLATKAVAVFRDLLPKDGKRPNAGAVFPGVTGEAIKRAFARACKRAGIEDFHFHDLRHEGTSRLFEKGLNPIEAATVTGHKTLQMLKRYTHLRAEDLVKKMG